MRLVNWGSVRSTEVTRSQYIGRLRSHEVKCQNKGLILIICHCLFLHIYLICPGSGFVSLHTDPVPDPTFIIQIRIRITGCWQVGLLIRSFWPDMRNIFYRLRFWTRSESDASIIAQYVKIKEVNNVNGTVNVNTGMKWNWIKQIILEKKVSCLGFWERIRISFFSARNR